MIRSKAVEFITLGLYSHHFYIRKMIIHKITSFIWLVFGVIFEGHAKNNDGILKKFNINPEETEAFLEWSFGTQTKIELEKIVGEDDCIFKSKFSEENFSNILLTGCKGEERSLQIQSVKFGDILATVSEDGNVELFHGYLPKDEILENPNFFKEFGKSENHNRQKRALNNLEDQELPERLTLNLNVYESSSWISGKKIIWI